MDDASLPLTSAGVPASGGRRWCSAVAGSRRRQIDVPFLPSARLC